MRRLAIRGWAIAIVAVLGALTLVATPQQQAEALSGSDFDPGYIISDSLFYDGNAMSEAQIQSFLTAASGSCQNTNCLAVHRISTTTTSAGFGPCATYQGAPDEPASRIIFKVQQACGISAKVLLVTLQKEQGLVTKSAPTSLELRKAMGQGCPDTSDCDANYYGLQKQLYYGSRQLTWYGNPAGSFTYIKVGQSNNIQYHPNAACGTGPVTVRNRATAALYYYTPYQPNAASLRNLYGTGDACSSYGNRNFWVHYTNWFGPPTSLGAVRIDQAYSAYGGSGALGNPITDYLTVSANGGGLARAYERGSIYWTERTGAHVVTGPLRDYYHAKGGEAGFLAWPLTGPLTSTANGGGLGQAFQGGSVYWSQAAGAHAVHGEIRRVYHSYGGETGGLGWPTSELLSVAANGGGYGQAFQGGSIYNANGRSGYAVTRDIRQAYFALGGEAGRLGWPASPELTVTANGGGLGQVFDGGSIYWSPGRGAFAVVGGIRAFYFSLGGETGQLGWPASNEACTAGECWQDFQNGSVYWSPSTGAVVRHRAIEAVYQQQGGEAGGLGARTSGLIRVTANGGGYGQAFTNGSIYWTAAHGAFPVQNAIRSYYFTLNGEAGRLGWPVAAEVPGPGGVWSQKFQNGTIEWSPASGGRVV